jgi:hypothetical protein
MSRKVLLKKRKLGGVGPGGAVVDAPLKFMTQSARILRKFGGPKRMVKLMALAGKKMTLNAISRWELPQDLGGTAGIIPAEDWPTLFLAARMDGVVILPEDLDPRLMPWDGRERDYVLCHPGKVFLDAVNLTKKNSRAILQEAMDKNAKKPKKCRPRERNGVNPKTKAWRDGLYTPKDTPGAPEPITPEPITPEPPLDSGD